MQVVDEIQKDYEVGRHALFFNDTGSRDLYQVLLLTLQTIPTPIQHALRCSHSIAEWWLSWQSVNQIWGH